MSRFGEPVRTGSVFLNRLHVCGALAHFLHRRESVFLACYFFIFFLLDLFCFVFVVVCLVDPAPAHTHTHTSTGRGKTLYLRYTGFAGGFVMRVVAKSAIKYLRSCSVLEAFFRHCGFYMFIKDFFQLLTKWRRIENLF